MAQFHIPRKRFGQHFLTDQNVIAKIVRAIHAQPSDNLVEIGPGQGAITKLILAHIPHLQAIEIDRDLSQQLRLDHPNQLTLIEADALEFDFSTLGQSHPLRIFGNLPYNISTPLLFHLLSFAPCIKDMIFMLQKEVVMRMTAPCGCKEYGRLSVMIQYACQTQALFDIGPNSFSPPPKVMSTVIRLVPFQHERPHPLAQDYALFAQVVAIAFQHRRKTLKNALETLVPKEVFAQVDLDTQRRPETLSVAEFVNLSNILFQHQTNLSS